MTGNINHLSLFIQNSSFNICYYSTVQVKLKSLAVSPFCHDFCSRKTKISPKLLIITAFTPKLKHGVIDTHYFKSAE
jgi:hypothetical protein